MSESDTMFNEWDQRCTAVQLMLSTDPSYDNSTIASTLAGLPRITGTSPGWWKQSFWLRLGSLVWLCQLWQALPCFIQNTGQLFIRSHYQYILWSPPLENQTAEPKLYHWTTGLYRTVCGCWFDLQWWRSQYALLMRPNKVKTAVKCSICHMEVLARVHCLRSMDDVLLLTYTYIYIYCHPQTDCFILSELFSVARHAGRSKLGSKPVQLYIRLSFGPVGHQADYVG